MPTSGGDWWHILSFFEVVLSVSCLSLKLYSLWFCLIYCLKECGQSLSGGHWRVSLHNSMMRSRLLQLQILISAALGIAFTLPIPIIYILMYVRLIFQDSTWPQSCPTSSPSRASSSWSESSSGSSSFWLASRQAIRRSCTPWLWH